MTDEIYEERNQLYRELRRVERAYEAESYVSENLHQLLQDHGIIFRCECPRSQCREMRVYLDTIH